MNYLAVYNKEIGNLREKICKKCNDQYEFYIPKKVMYSRYDYIYGKLKIVATTDNIRIKEVEKDTISIIFDIGSFKLRGYVDLERIWTSIFIGLKDGFENNQYLDIKEKFLEVTDEQKLSELLRDISLVGEVKSELKEKLLEIFKETAMYRNVCDDYRNFAKNYEKIMKDSNYEVELFRIRFLSNGKLQTISNKRGKERKRTYDDFESIRVDLILDNDGRFFKVSGYIDTELENFGTRLR